jgi:hypothetical protein
MMRENAFYGDETLPRFYAVYGFRRPDDARAVQTIASGRNGKYYIRRDAINRVSTLYCNASLRGYAGFAVRMTRARCALLPIRTRKDDNDLTALFFVPGK